jgi:hypothetical protein
MLKEQHTSVHKILVNIDGKYFEKKGRIMMKYILGLVFVSFLMVACSPFSPEVRAMNVYELEFRVPKECNTLGEVEVRASSVMSEEAAKRVARDDLRQKSYDQFGANALYVETLESNFVGATPTVFAKGMAYQCPQ